jgi:hypothetical protein
MQYFLLVLVHPMFGFLILANRLQSSKYMARPTNKHKQAWITPSIVAMIPFGVILDLFCVCTPNSISEFPAITS